MRAIRVSSFGASDVLRCLKDVALPSPGCNQVVVAVSSAGVNPVDTYIRSGNYARKPSLPYTPSLDGAGVVHAIGENVKNLKPGDRVWFWSSLSGACAEYSLCSSNRVHHLASALSFEQGACIGTPYLTAYRALYQRHKLSANDRILVHGASGGVGIAACQLALAKGASVYATAGTEEGMTLLRKLGIANVYNHREPMYITQLQNDVSDGGFTCILEMLANVNLCNDLNLISKGGRIVIVGNRGEISINPRAIMAKESEVTAVMLFNASEDELKKATEEIQSGFHSGVLNPVIQQTYPLEHISLAHDDIIAGGGAKGNLIIAIQ